MSRCASIAIWYMRCLGVCSLASTFSHSRIWCETNTFYSHVCLYVYEVFLSDRVYGDIVYEVFSSLLRFRVCAVCLCFLRCVLSTILLCCFYIHIFPWAPCAWHVLCAIWIPYNLEPVCMCMCFFSRSLNIFGSPLLFLISYVRICRYNSVLGQFWRLICKQRDDVRREQLLGQIDGALRGMCLSNHIMIYVCGGFVLVCNCWAILYIFISSRHSSRSHSGSAGTGEGMAREVI